MISSKMLIVMKHEFRQKLRSKFYVVSTVAGPLFFLALFALPVLFSKINQSEDRTFAIVDSTGRLAPYFLKLDSMHSGGVSKTIKFQATTASPALLDTLRKETERGDLTGYLVIGANAIDERIATVANLKTKNPNDFSSSQTIDQIYRDAVRQERLRSHGIEPAVMQEIQNIPEIETVKISAGEKEAADSGGSFAAGYLTGFIIYMSMILYGSMIMRSVIEEKSSRIIEVMVSSIRPYDLLLGKVFGNALAAFLQVFVWAVILVLLTTVGVTAVQDYLGPSFHLTISPYLFIYFILYFIMGFLIYATLYAAVGATVDQDSDAQQASLPITLLVVLPILTLTSIIQAPSSSTSVILSLIPFFSPVLMMGRIFSETPPFWQIALSIVLMTLTFLGVLWLAARIYRVGILMYGKRFTPKEVVKWLRYN